jgi:hypothetical protein
MPTRVIESTLPSRTSGVVSPVIYDILDRQAALFDQTVTPTTPNLKNILVLGIAIFAVIFIVKKVSK